jgi:hypothetical protein
VPAVRHVFVLCTGDHYFLVNDSPFCPLDGASSQVSESVARLLSGGAEDVTLAALARVSGPAVRRGDVLVAELPDGVAPPWLLQPRFGDLRRRSRVDASASPPPPPPGGPSTLDT